MSGLFNTNHQGNNLVVILLDADWSRPMEIDHALETEVERGRSGRESRSAKREAMRLTQKCTFTLEKADADSLRFELYGLQDKLVAIPLMPDVRDEATWAARVYDAEYFLNWDDGGYQILAKGTAGPYTYTWLAPMLVGRLRDRPRLETLNDEEARFTLTVVEDSPWIYRIAPAPESVGTNWPAALEPNWTRVVDFSEDQIELSKIGEGRESVVSGDEGVMRWGQEARFTLDGTVEIRTLLQFFLARYGRQQAFDMPVWFRPGPDRPETPYTTKIRFGADRMRLRYLDPQTTDGTLRFLQVPWEISPPEGEQAQQPATAWLYKFTYKIPGSPIIDRYTSYEKPLTNADGTYNPGPFEHRAIRRGIDLDVEPVTIVSHVFTGNPLMRFLPFKFEAALKVEIYEVDPADPSTTTALKFKGEILTAKPRGKRIEAQAVTLGGRLESQVPAFLIQPDCNYIVYEPNTCKVAKAGFEFLGTLVSVTGSDVTIDVTANPPTHDLVDDYFANGWIEKGAGAAYERRPIVRSVKITASQQKITVRMPFDSLPGGAAFKWWPGCDGQPSTCKNRFNNFINFGGHPHVPQENPSLPTRDIASQTGKK